MCLFAVLENGASEAVFDEKDNELADFRKEKAAQWAVTVSVTATVNLMKYNEGKCKDDRYFTIKG